RNRERNGWDDEWYDDDEYDDEYGDEYDDDYEEDDEEDDDPADPAGDGDDREEELPGESEVKAQNSTKQKRTKRESDTQFKLPFDDI
ncbi:MAG: hypothetical protein KAS29_20500, partial [Bacteroidales bacterium]|nr:hypothetical protein [Bacteroidales bacterium]